MYIVIVLQCICLQSSDCDTLSPSTDTPEPEINRNLKTSLGNKQQQQMPVVFLLWYFNIYLYIVSVQKNMCPHCIRIYK